MFPIWHLSKLLYMWGTFDMSNCLCVWAIIFNVCHSQRDGTVLHMLCNRAHCWNWIVESQWFFPWVEGSGEIKPHGKKSKDKTVETQPTCRTDRNSYIEYRSLPGAQSHPRRKLETWHWLLSWKLWIVQGLEYVNHKTDLPLCWPQILVLCQ